MKAERKKVLTIGTFDTPHIGHAILFKRCEGLGELTVGVNSDDFVQVYKGKKPLYSTIERMALIEEMGYQTYPNVSAGRDLVRMVKPDFIVIGSDWARKDYLKQIDVTQDELDLWGISLVYVPYTDGISSTDLKERVLGSVA